MHSAIRKTADINWKYIVCTFLLDATESITSASYLYLLSIGRESRMVNFKLPFTTNEMISISTSQTFCSWEVIFRLRRSMAFLSLSLYDTPGRAPRMNIFLF